MQIVRKEILQLNSKCAIGRMTEYVWPCGVVGPHECVREPPATCQQASPFRSPRRIVRVELIGDFHRAVEVGCRVVFGVVNRRRNDRLLEQGEILGTGRAGVKLAGQGESRGKFANVEVLLNPLAGRQRRGDWGFLPCHGRPRGRTVRFPYYIQKPLSVPSKR